MQKLIRSTDVDREPEAVFDLLADPARYPEFFVGITRWERCSTKERGLGAEFRVLMRVGSIEAGGMVRVTDWQEPLTIAWRSERGTEQHGRWTVTPHENGHTEVTLEIAYDLAGRADRTARGARRGEGRRRQHGRDDARAQADPGVRGAPPRSGCLNRTYVLECHGGA
jgi:ribosome-associated toxin RatA of RatAB toxin-antitoxin module